MNFTVVDLGFMPYSKALRIQEERLEQIVQGREGNVLFLVEHPSVITLGADFHSENLLLSSSEYAALGFELISTGRGGDVTYHGPGQLVAYPVFDLDLVGKDLHRWLRLLEEAIIVCLSEIGIKSGRFAPHTGVWVGDRKIAAIGIKVRRWVSMHGLALNCNVDLTAFKTIVPCGISEHGVTSISEVLGHELTVGSAKPSLIRAFSSVFDDGVS